MNPRTRANNLVLLQQAVQDAKKKKFQRFEDMSPEAAANALANWLIHGSGTLFGYLGTFERENVNLARGEPREFGRDQRFRLAQEITILRLAQVIDRFVLDEMLLDPWIKRVLAITDADGRKFAVDLKLVKKDKKLVALAELGDSKFDRPIFDLALSFLRGGAEIRPERGKKRLHRATIERASVRELASIWTIARMEERIVYNESLIRFNRSEARRLREEGRVSTAEAREAVAVSQAVTRDGLRRVQGNLIEQSILSEEEFIILQDRVRSRAEDFIVERIIEDPKQAARFFLVDTPAGLAFVRNPRVMRNLFITGRGLVPEQADEMLSLWVKARERLFEPNLPIGKSRAAREGRVQIPRPSSFIINRAAASAERGAQAVKRLLEEAEAQIGAGELRVLFVFDGDTVLLSDGRTVRLIGVDADELGTRSGNNASAELGRFLKGKLLRVELDPAAGIDPAARTLVYLFATDSTTGEEEFVNARVLRRGGAALDLRPDLKRECQLRKAAAELERLKE